MDGAEVITFRVPAIPVAQPRQRHRIIPGANFVQNYTPTKHPVTAFKATVRLAAAAAYSGAPLKGPIRMDVTYVLPFTGTRRKTKPNPRRWHEVKPDRDNLEKALLDALKGLVIVDDKQVCCGEVRKIVAAADEQPHVDVTIQQAEPLT
jgi:Holliday junction resolvase RusA-like endonuclease